MIVDYDPVTLTRRDVSRAEVAARFRGWNNAQAAAVVEAIPARADGSLDPHAVDDLLLRVHTELQRLNEEFQQGRRVLALLRPLLDTLRATGAPRPLRVVDVGCGLGFVVRWLAAHGQLGDDVELLGCDMNRALIEAASEVARHERLPCAFRLANAFALEQPATVFLSTGVVHHFRGEGLLRFFQGQAGPATRAFLHWDIAPTWLAPLGSWIFHVARMREPRCGRTPTRRSSRPRAPVPPGSRSACSTCRVACSRWSRSSAR